MNKQDIEQIIAVNKIIGQFEGRDPEIEYCIGDDDSICFSPKNCGYSWPPQQKQECERWISEHIEYAERNGYSVKKREWWPWYNQDWNKLMPIWFKFRDLRFQEELHQFRHSNLKELISRAICYEDIEMAHQRLFEAIVWYNENVKNHSGN